MINQGCGRAPLTLAGVFAICNFCKEPLLDDVGAGVSQSLPHLK